MGGTVPKKKNAVIFEMDCKGLVDQALGGKSNMTKCGIFLNHIMHMLILHLGFSIQFTSRKINFVAHSLARHSVENLNNCVCFFFLVVFKILYQQK